MLLIMEGTPPRRGGVPSIIIIIGIVPSIFIRLTGIVPPPRPPETPILMLSEPVPPPAEKYFSPTLDLRLARILYYVCIESLKMRKFNV